MGLIGGTAAIPEDWREYIGDRIVQYCVGAHYDHWLPKTCTALTERVIKTIPKMLGHHGVEVEFTDGKPEIDRNEAIKVLDGYSAKYFDRSRLSFDITDFFDLRATVEYEKDPVIKAGEEFTVSIKFTQLIGDRTVFGFMDIPLPEGWTAKYNKTITIVKEGDLFEVESQNLSGIKQNVVEITLVPGENIQPVNKLYIHIDRQTHAIPFVIPITLLG